MTIKLWHCDGARSLRPLWTLEEMGLDYELIKMKFPPRFMHDGYTDINPIGTVPFFTDDRAGKDLIVKMTESSGICHYLVDKYGPTPLQVNSDQFEYGDYLNWLYRSDATFTFPQTLVFRYTVLESEENRNPQIVNDYTRWFFSRLRSLETALCDKEFLVGDRFTIADIAVGYALTLAESLDLSCQFKDNVSNYFSRLKKRDAYQRALAL